MDYTLRTVNTINNIFFVAKDIAYILGYKNTKKAIRDHVNNEDKILYGEIKDICELLPFKLQINTILLHKKGVISLLIYGKKYNESFLSFFKDKYNINYDVLKRLSKEEEYIKYILQSFEGEEMILQFSTKSNFKIDLYFPAYNICVECDEYGHNDRNIEYDHERESKIIKELNCVFIRFNPDDKNFSIFSVINQIYKQICSLKISTK